VPQDARNPQKGLGFDLDTKDLEEYRNKRYIPLQLQSNVFVANGPSANKNVSIWIEALNLRKQYLESMGQTTFATAEEAIKSYDKNNEQSKMVNATDKLIQDATAQKGMIDSSDKTKHYLLNMITVKVSSANIFKANFGSQLIAQAYSYRVGDVYNQDTMFNPGEPTCWDINFPDVISADFQYDIWGAAMSVAAGLRITGNTDRGSMAINSQNKIATVKLLDDANKIIADTGHKLKQSISSADIDKLRKISTELHSVDPGDTLSGASPAKVSAYPINVNIADYQHSRIYSGDYYNMLERKRNVQNIRAQLATTSTLINADLEVLGDATFAFTNINSTWMFLKIINVDGSLSTFTGLYKLNNVTHEISAGKFTTKLKLVSDFVSDAGISGSAAEQMQKIIYHSDKQKANMGE
jgi:ribosomal protein S20